MLITKWCSCQRSSKIRENIENWIHWVDNRISTVHFDLFEKFSAEIWFYTVQITYTLLESCVFNSMFLLLYHIIWNISRKENIDEREKFCKKNISSPLTWIEWYFVSPYIHTANCWAAFKAAISNRLTNKTNHKCEAAFYKRNAVVSLSLFLFRFCSLTRSVISYHIHSNKRAHTHTHTMWMQDIQDKFSICSCLCVLYKKKCDLYDWKLGLGNRAKEMNGKFSNEKNSTLFSY